MAKAKTKQPVREQEEVRLAREYKLHYESSLDVAKDGHGYYVFEIESMKPFFNITKNFQDFINYMTDTGIWYYHSFIQLEIDDIWYEKVIFERTDKSLEDE